MKCVLREEVLPSDCQSVQSLVASTEFFRSDEIDVAVELVEERLVRGAASSYYFIFAEHDGQVAGYACYGPIACTLASYDLYWIAVDRRFQGQGIGRLLMEAVEQRISAAGGTRIYIDTSGRPLYSPTQSFYEHSGFHCEARLVDFYAPGDDRLIYTKVVASR